ncbi:MAG TPA: hypothetical protein VH500_14750 [Nitrososphaeraceae archaeon]|jgi:hypothetical protein
MQQIIELFLEYYEAGHELSDSDPDNNNKSRLTRSSPEPDYQQNLLRESSSLPA